MMEPALSVIYNVNISEQTVSHTCNK